MCSVLLIVNFEQMSHSRIRLFTWNKDMLAELVLDNLKKYIPISCIYTETIESSETIKSSI